MSKLRINIKELESGTGGLTSGATYTCEIVGGDYPKDGHWVISEGENKIKIKENTFKVSSSSGTTVTITYYKGTYVIKKRTINVL